MDKRVTENRQKLVDFIVDKINNGGVVPWRDPCFNSLPQNAVSGKAYRGMNNLILSVEALNQGYKDPRWITFKQAKEKGYHLKKGSKGTMIEFYEFHKPKKLTEEEKAALKEKGKSDRAINAIENGYAIIKSYIVFNAAQFSNFPELPKNEEIKTTIERPEDLEKIIKNSEAPVFYDATNSNYYSPRRDEVHLRPREHFRNINDFYSTAMHEIGHSTGHKSRLDRFPEERSRKSYAKEELVAELNSAFINQKYNIGISQDQVEQNASYLHSWAQEIKDDPTFLFKAITQADQSMRYIEEHMLNKNKVNEEEPQKTVPNDRIESPPSTEKKPAQKQGVKFATRKNKENDGAEL